MVLYIIKSGLCLALVLGSYHLLLEGKKMHQFNRIFLLFGLVFSFSVPLLETNFSIDFLQYLSQPDLIVANNLTSDPQSIASSEVSQSIVYSSEKYSVFLKLACFISGILMLRFCCRVTMLIRKALLNERVNYKGAQLVLLKEKVLPHTFGKYIFLNESDYRTQKLDDKLFTHELTHARGWHSLDIVLIEVLHVLFWCNPLLILYKKAIQLNHEFLADDRVVRSHIGVRHYQELLLANASFGQVSLVSNLNFSVTKKRLTMMTKKTRRRTTILFASATIPLFVCLLMLFSCGKADDLPIDEPEPIEVAHEITDPSVRAYESLPAIEVTELDLKDGVYAYLTKFITSGTATFYADSGKEVTGEETLVFLSTHGRDKQDGFSFTVRLGEDKGIQIHFQGYDW